MAEEGSPIIAAARRVRQPQLRRVSTEAMRNLRMLLSLPDVGGIRPQGLQLRVSVEGRRGTTMWKRMDTTRREH